MKMMIETQIDDKFDYMFVVFSSGTSEQIFIHKLPCDHDTIVKNLIAEKKGSRYWGGGKLKIKTNYPISQDETSDLIEVSKHYNLSWTNPHRSFNRLLKRTFPSCKIVDRDF